MKDTNIIIIGSKEDFTSTYILETLQKQNVNAKFFDSRIYPILSWEPNSDDNYLILDGEKIYTKTLSSVYLRWYYGVILDTNYTIYREKTSALESFLYSLEPISWNSLQSIELHRKKGFQNKILEANDIRIPKTLITNDKQVLEKFYINQNKNIIFKPVQKGAYTKKMHDENLKRIDTLINCPCQFQEFIDGTDIRTYAFQSGEVFAGEIIANNIDYRADSNAKINKIELPTSVQKDCLKILKLLGLKFSSIDMKLSKTGEYVFFEANPAPNFYDFEKATNYPITQTLIRNLLQNNM